MTWRLVLVSNKDDQMRNVVREGLTHDEAIEHARQIHPIMRDDIIVLVEDEDLK